MKKLETDVCVIGSGASAGVLAWYAARNKNRTLILERGGYFRGLEMGHHEASMVASLYKDGGLQFNTTFDMYLLQGNCVGGSSTVSNAVCFRIPDKILTNWQNEFGFPISKQELEKSYENVEKYSHVVPIEQKNLNKSAYKFIEGSKKLGLKWQPLKKMV